MKRNRRKKAALLILGLPAMLLCLLVWLTWREVRQSRLNRALILALHNHEIAHVVTLLHQGADPNARDVPERPLTWGDLLNRRLHRSSVAGLADTALMVAVRAGRRDEVDSLLHKGANPNLSNAHQDTPISIALNADAHRAHLIQDLLMHGVNTNTRMIDVQGRSVSACTTLLIKIFNIPYASMDVPARRQLEKLLLDRGADIQATDEHDQSPLMAACTLPNQNAEIAHWLMERGADINHADQKGQTSLLLAINCTPIRTELLRRGVDITPAHNRGWNLLIWAAEEDNLSALQTALKRGIPVDSRDKMQRTPLMIAAAYGNRRSISLLLAHGATIDAQDKNGWTALMFAAQHGDVAVIHALLQHGANPRLRDSEHGWTAAQRAASVGQEQTAPDQRVCRPSGRYYCPGDSLPRRQTDRPRSALHAGTATIIPCRRAIVGQHGVKFSCSRCQGAPGFSLFRADAI